MLQDLYDLTAFAGRKGIRQRHDRVLIAFYCDFNTVGDVDLVRNSVPIGILTDRKPSKSPLRLENTVAVQFIESVEIRAGIDTVGDGIGALTAIVSGRLIVVMPYSIRIERSDRAVRGFDRIDLILYFQRDIIGSREILKIVEIDVIPDDPVGHVVGRIGIAVVAGTESRGVDVRSVAFRQQMKRNLYYEA